MCARHYAGVFACIISKSWGNPKLGKYYYQPQFVSEKIKVNII